MSDRSTAAAALRRECDVLCRFLVDTPATPYVIAAYVRGHQTNPVLSTRAHGFDRWHLAVAALHPIGARLADSYARLCRPAGVLRHKLVLLLAILESCAPGYEAFERPDRGTPAGVLLLLAWHGIAFALIAPIALLLFAPAHLIAAGVARLRSAPPVRHLAATAPRADRA